MKERPILFNSEMVRAILTGSKTQTRPVINHPYPPPDTIEMFYWWRGAEMYLSGVHGVSGGYFKTSRSTKGYINCRYGEPGDRLWVKETWAPVDFLLKGYEMNPAESIGYKADLKAVYLDKINLSTKSWDWHLVKWKPSIFMPRWANRILLKIEDIRVEQVQNITEEDAISEGMLSLDQETIFSMFPDYKKSYESTKPGEKPPLGPSPRQRFMKLWDKLNAKRGLGWSTNPWVWVITFEVVEK